MKKYYNRILQVVAFAGVTAILLSCGDGPVFFQDVSPAEGARVKFVHSASDASGVHFYVNESKISSGAASGSSLNYSLSFPGTNYAALIPGSLSVKIAVPATATVAESVLVTSTISAEKNNYYTVALAGILGSYEAILLNDDVGAIAYDDKAYVRFVNLIHNSTNKVNVIAKLGTAAPITIAQNVAYKQVITFTGLDAGDYTITLVDAVNTSTVLATASATVRFLTPNKVYTLFARGQIGKTLALAPALDRMVNR